MTIGRHAVYRRRSRNAPLWNAVALVVLTWVALLIVAALGMTSTVGVIALVLGG